MDTYEISECFNTLSKNNKKYFIQRLKFVKDNNNWHELIDELLDIFEQDLIKKDFDYCVNLIIEKYSIDDFYDLIHYLNKHLK